MFIVIEGCDGIGKSLFTLELIKQLKFIAGKKIIHLKDPYNRNFILETIKMQDKFLHNNRDKLSCEISCYMSMRKIIADRIKSNYLENIYICERWHPSTVIYQGIINRYGFWDTVQITQQLPIAPDYYILLDAEEKNIYNSNLQKEGEFDILKDIFFNYSKKLETKEDWLLLFHKIRIGYRNYFRLFDNFITQKRLKMVYNDFVEPMSNIVKRFLEKEYIGKSFYGNI